MKELLSVWLVMRSLVDLVRDKVVLVITDNTTAVAYLRKQGDAHSRGLCNLAQDMYAWMAKNGVEVVCRHIAGRLNVIADGLSREGQILPTEWCIHPHILPVVWQ